MKVLISGGGTAGHINPAIAIAKRMQKEYNADILFVGKESGLEKTLVPKEGFSIRYIDVEGLLRKLTLKNFAVAAKYLRAISDAKKIIREFAPDVVVGTGGYVCAPVLSAAHALKIPVLVHEQNVFPGMTVKMAARFAECVAISFEDTMQYVSKKAKKACVLTGNPLRENMLELSYEAARAELGIDDTPFVVTVGGSLGARTINQALVEIMQLDETTKFRLLGSTGQRFYDAVLAQIDKTKLDETKTIVPYIYNMDKVLPAADLVIARAGAI
ncbi:MAG: UDP-N-acetylglucosamine--N-acetylmuramyl-(pentapeptide) pyrophosphoryl-undecaprenol N-acetylglucosamine transferase, partial [Clostridia bacterium]|nr:UDP-N-acetylglucosamine--N-acetylmuramyl-(pentapeptide) pyrophosphoryl-undecaprenol N-acetylglucosamine transferase [Clostridia bacterium]